VLQLQLVQHVYVRIGLEVRVDAVLRRLLGARPCQRGRRRLRLRLRVGVRFLAVAVVLARLGVGSSGVVVAIVVVVFTFELLDSRQRWQSGLL